MSGSGKSFRKSLRKSQPIREEDEDPGDASLMDDGLKAAVLTKDSLETDDSAVTPAVNITGVGLDTLEEEEEKARFFARVEAEDSSMIDYAKLNRDLDSSSSTITINLRRAEEAGEQSDDNQSKARVAEIARDSPGSPHYSEDFEDEKIIKEPLEEKSKMSLLLANVCLYDSMTGTGGQDSRKDTAGSLDKGQSYVQSGASEMEALQEAYRQIHVVEDSDDHCFPSLERKEKINRPMSPSSPSQHAQQSLQPASTTESELPTAEELMKLIRPEEDQVRGFSLQPVSSDQDKTPCSLGRTVTYTESQLMRPGKAGHAAGTKGARGVTGHASVSPDPPNHDQTWSIREEVEKLMQDQDRSSSHTSAHAAKAKKQPSFHGATVYHSSPSSVGKPTVAALRGRRVDGRTAVTSRSSGISRASAPTKAQSSVSTHFPQQPQRTKSTKGQKKDDSAEPGVRVSGELVASVQSLVAVLQQQMDTSSSHQDAAHQVSPQETRVTQDLPQISRDATSSVVEELRVQLVLKEKELQMMKEGAEELNSLRKQNYQLQSKLRSAEEANQKQRRLEAADPATEEKLQQIDKEMKEQEMLIKGYQQENEKLCLQMKAEKAKSKANEEDMFNENQRLLSELAFTREQLSKTHRPVESVCLMGHTQRITDLLAQINALQRNDAKLSDEVHNLKLEKRALEVDLQFMKKERDLAKAQAISTSGDKRFEMHSLEERHREEVSALKKELQWFAENQELLDRDAGRLKAATAEIHQLKEQVEQLKHEAGRRSSEQQRKIRDRSLDSKRMQELERQVKELEHILKNKNPNSLPALIYAAASAASHQEADAAGTSPSSIRTTALLERRIQRLEAELESHDEEAKRSLRAMEQQFHSIKLRYEKQISELEQQLEHKQPVEAAAAAGSEPWISKVQTVEEELQHVKQSHLEKEKCLHEQIKSLQQQLKHKTQLSPGRHQRQAEAAFGVRIERLNHELAAKARTIQELNRTVERLQKERRSMASISNPRPEPRSTETKPPGPTTTRETCAGEETFPAAQYERTYQPSVFTGSHISEVLQENEALKQQAELQQLQSEQEKEALKTATEQAKEELCRLKEQFAEQLSSTKAEHLRVLDHLRATHALEHSSSKVAELTNKLSTQEIVTKHLQEQLKELHKYKEALAVSKTREEALQKQHIRLLQELKEAKDAQSPERKFLCSLERKIINMELRHQQREKALQQVIEGAWQTSAADQPSEVERWKRLAQDKSREVEAFRVELDSILDIVRHLQRHGVVLHTPDPLPQELKLTYSTT